MKKNKVFIIASLALAVMLLSALLFESASFAGISGFEQFHDLSAPRITDRADILSDSFEKETADRIAKAGELYGIDFVVLTVSGYSASEFGSEVEAYYKREPGGMGFDDYVADFYDYNGYGLGDTFSGIILGINMDPDDRMYWFITTGEAEDIYEAHISALKNGVQPYLSAGQYEKAIDFYIDYAENVAKEAVAGKRYNFKRTDFVNADPVYDKAGILTAADIEKFGDLSEKVEAKYGCDLILLTAKTDYSPYEFGTEVGEFYEKRGIGYTLSDYASDFLNYNSYGKGTGGQQNAVIVALSKEGAGYTSGCFSVGSIKPLQMGIYNEQNFFVKDAAGSGECVEGICDYINFVLTLHYDSEALRQKGSVIPEKEAAGDLPLVIDNAGVLGKENVKKLTEKLEKARNDLKTDIVIVTFIDYNVSDNGREAVVAFNHGFYGNYYDLDEYGADYLRSMGYGYGENKEAVILLLYDDHGYKDFAVSASGPNAVSRIIDKDNATLTVDLDNMLNSIIGNSWQRTADRFVTYMRFKLTIGHYPLTVGLVIFLVLVSLFIGLIITLIRTARSDNNVKEAPAGIYVDNSHISIRDTNQVFIRSVTSRVYVSSSSGGGSSGFGGGHSSGSSGVSHGGGGGRF